MRIALLMIATIFLLVHARGVSAQEERHHSSKDALAALRASLEVVESSGHREWIMQIAPKLRLADSWGSSLSGTQLRALLEGAARTRRVDPAGLCEPAAVQCTVPPNVRLIALSPVKLHGDTASVSILQWVDASSSHRGNGRSTHQLELTKVDGQWTVVRHGVSYHVHRVNCARADGLVCTTER